MNPELRVTIGDLAETIRGVTYQKAEASNNPREGYSPLIRATNIDHGALVLNSFVYVPDVVIRDDQRLRVGDIVLAASSGSLSVVGKAALLRSQWPGTFGAFCYVVRPKSERVVPDYLAYFMQTSNYRRRVSELAAGVNINNLRREHIESVDLPYCALAEQQRIVEAIDSYLTRLDDAVASLKRVQAKLKAYRASVLKAALEGRLVPTEAALARSEKRTYEPADALLARILKERRRRWEEAELAKLKAAGKTPTNDKWKAKYEEPVAPDTSMLPELPEGWCWATVDMLGHVKGGLTKGQKRHPKQILRDVPYLRVANVQRGYLDLSEIKTIRATPDEITELRLEPGDVLFNEGGDRDKLGRGWIWGGEIETCIHQNHVFRVRIFTEDLQPRLLSWYGNTSGQRYFFDEGKQTTNLASVNMTKLKLLPVPIPPKREQTRIADEVERVLSVADEVAVGVTHDIKRCVRLRQSILKWAFEGKLVDQDPTDEPAEKLLARIRAERAAVDPIKNNRSRKAQRAA